MDLEGIMLTEVSDRDRQMPYDITYMWNIKKIKQTSEYNKRNRYTDKENILLVTSGEREGGSGKIGVRD